ncbi:MAG: hypothetical protein FD161_1235 [Limisphaerales bacterium]|nr:MAG: hypothetical protein FD161_1235 [Limisphaerales bacterium]TXT49507.1 MAG: hypothetical protein FD140_3039 [Limisphaerales bacterium]
MTVNCPNCARRLRAPANKPDARLRCPACRTEFAIAPADADAAASPPASQPLPREAREAARTGFFTGALLFGAVTWLGMPAEPLLNVSMAILLWPAGLVNAVMVGSSSGWVVVALAKFISLVGVGAFFAYLFFNLRLNTGLAFITFALTAGVSWWLWATYLPTWATAPPPLWMIVFLWPGKLLATALQDAGAKGAGGVALGTAAMLAMASMTGLIYATVICGVRTLFRARSGPLVTSGDGTPPQSSPG